MEAVDNRLIHRIVLKATQPYRLVTIITSRLLGHIFRNPDVLVLEVEFDQVLVVLLDLLQVLNH